MGIGTCVLDDSDCVSIGAGRAASGRDIDRKV